MKMFTGENNRTDVGEPGVGEAGGKITRGLLIDLRGGDPSAFETVYLHYAGPVKNFLTALTRSDEAGDEITQEVFVTLWEKRDRIDPERGISGYLYTIAKNYAFKYLSKGKHLVYESDGVAEPSDLERSPAEILIQKEKELLVEIAIRRMPTQRRKIFEMSRKEGLSNGEIAEKLNLSKNTVENHITSALKDLREVLTFFMLLLLIK